MHAYASPDIELDGGGTIDCMAFGHGHAGPMVMVTITCDERFANLKPERARQLAAYLIEAADAAEGKNQ